MKAFSFVFLTIHVIFLYFLSHLRKEKWKVEKHLTFDKATKEYYIYTVLFSIIFKFWAKFLSSWYVVVLIPFYILIFPFQFKIFIDSWLMFFFVYHNIYEAYVPIFSLMPNKFFFSKKNKKGKYVLRK